MDTQKCNIDLHIPTLYNKASTNQKSEESLVKLLRQTSLFSKHDLFIQEIRMSNCEHLILEMNGQGRGRERSIKGQCKNASQTIIKAKVYHLATLWNICNIYIQGESKKSGISKNNHFS